MLVVVEIDLLVILVLGIVMVAIIFFAVGNDEYDDCGTIYIHPPVKTKLWVRVDLGVLYYGVRRCQNIPQGAGEGGG